MKSSNYLILFLIVSGCGIKVKGELAPVEVNVTHKVDFNSLTNYFKEVCKTKLSKDGNVPTQKEIDECVTDSVFDFMDALEAAGKK